MNNNRGLFVHKQKGVVATLILFLSLVFLGSVGEAYASETRDKDFIGKWKDKEGYVSLQLEAGGSGFLFLFDYGGGSGPVNAGGIKWEATENRITFSGHVGSGSGVLSDDGNELRVTILGQGKERILLRQQSKDK